MIDDANFLTSCKLIPILLGNFQLFLLKIRKVELKCMSRDNFDKTIKISELV